MQKISGYLQNGSSFKWIKSSLDESVEPQKSDYKFPDFLPKLGVNRTGFADAARTERCSQNSVLAVGLYLL